MKPWNVVLNRGAGLDLGQVNEKSEELARCAALHKYGISEDEIAEGADIARRITPEDDFSVYPA